MNNNQATLNKMQAMRLHGMVCAFRASMETGVKHKFTPDELLSHLVDAEWDERSNRKITRYVKSAKFRYEASVEEIDFTLNRNLDKNQVLRLTDCSWIMKRKNILFTGPTGIGKSFIAQALGYQACLFGYRTGYFQTMKYFKNLKYARSENTYLQEMKKLQKLQLIILDDLGLEPFDAAARLSLLEILEDRYNRASTIIVSQIPVSRWHEIIGDQTIADAICDRVVHSAYRIDMQGESVRKLYSNRD
jgi:DNA replication protein DnaC